MGGDIFFSVINTSDFLKVGSRNPALLHRIPQSINGQSARIIQLFQSCFHTSTLQHRQDDIIDSGTVERIPAEFEMPNFKDILKYHSKTHIACARFSDGYYSDDDMFHHISTQSGEYVVSCFNQPKVAILVMLNGELNQVWVKKTFLGPITDLESIGLTDMYFQEYTGYTYDEFFSRYDINYAPQFADVVGNVLVKDMYFDNPAIGYCLRKGILRIYAAKSNYKMKFGTFDYRLLIENLPNLDMEDIDEMQDILDEINPKYEEMVKGMIKKGKIRIKV